MADLERAIAIAVEAHRGQVDKAGVPYILHPLRVMLKLSTEEERIVGVLHDVVEDTPWTFESLEREGFAPSVIDALRSVTRKDSESYEEFVLRASRNPIGRRVKLADLMDNSDPSRIENPTEADLQRMAKYARAIDLLSSSH